LTRILAGSIRRSCKGRRYHTAYGQPGNLQPKVGERYHITRHPWHSEYPKLCKRFRVGISLTSMPFPDASKHVFSKSLRRFVLLSSVAAVATPGTQYTEFDESSWANVAVEEVEEKGDAASALVIYRASKVLAERAAWDFVKANEGSIPWDLVAINPPYVRPGFSSSAAAADCFFAGIWGKHSRNLSFTPILLTICLASHPRGPLTRFAERIHERDVSSAGRRQKGCQRPSGAVKLVHPRPGRHRGTGSRGECSGGGWRALHHRCRAVVLAERRYVFPHIRCYFSRHRQALTKCAVDIARQIDPSLPVQGTTGAARGKEHPVYYNTSKAARVLGLKDYRSLEQIVKESLAYFKEFEAPANGTAPAS